MPARSSRLRNRQAGMPATPNLMIAASPRGEIALAGHQRMTPLIFDRRAARPKSLGPDCSGRSTTGGVPCWAPAACDRLGSHPSGFRLLLGSPRVARETGLQRGLHRGLGRLMSVVACQACESPRALGIATAPGQGDSRRANPTGVCPWRRDHYLGGVQVVTVGAELCHFLGRLLLDVGDGQIRKRRRDRRDVIAAGTMTTLATHRAVGRLRADTVGSRPCVRRMTL